jgi:hypothetical protein
MRHGMQNSKQLHLGYRWSDHATHPLIDRLHAFLSVGKGLLPVSHSNLSLGLNFDHEEEVLCQCDRNCPTFEADCGAGTQAWASSQISSGTPAASTA